MAAEAKAVEGLAVGGLSAIRWHLLACTVPTFAVAVVIVIAWQQFGSLMGGAMSGVGTQSGERQAQQPSTTWSKRHWSHGMDEDNTTYPEYRHAPMARYGRFRIDRTWIRTPPAEVQEFLPELVCEIDASSEFDLMGSWIFGGVSVLRRLKAGEAIATSEVRSIVTGWIGRMRPIPGGGLVSLACYRRRIGPPDANHEGTPGEWYFDHHFRRPGRPLIDMHEAVPLVEAALRELEETETNTAG